MIVGGVAEGVKVGLKLGTAALAFCLFEETVDQVRHDRRDFLSTVTAGLSLSGIYSMLGKLILFWLCWFLFVCVWFGDGADWV